MERERVGARVKERGMERERVGARVKERGVEREGRSWSDGGRD